ncbi:MAG: chromate transporter [Anaerolineales bacterium]
MALLWELFTTFMKLGTIAYGGGPSMIPIIEADVVSGKGWVTDADFRTALATGYGLPGPLATKMAFWVGLQVAGWAGALVATAGVVIPSILMMAVAVTVLWENMGNNSVLRGAAKGASIGVVGLLAYVVYDQAFKVFARDHGGSWLAGFRAHPDWIALVIVVFGLALWRPALMVPLSIIGAAIYGAIALR